MANTSKLQAKPLRKLIAGNWKMNGLSKDIGEVKRLHTLLKKTPVQADIAICPPATLLVPMAQVTRGSDIRLGGQDCHMAQSGAHTGDISAAMIKNTGARYVIIGHSERRTDHNETNAMVAQKMEAAHNAGLIAIMCLGETLKERKSGKALAIIGGQLRGSLAKTATAKNTVIAYEPVWAIGTGLVPTNAEIMAAHLHLRKNLVKKLGVEGAKTRILYGGSVKPSNAEEILNLVNVDGALVGGASLKASDFIQIIRSVG